MVVADVLPPDAAALARSARSGQGTAQPARSAAGGRAEASCWRRLPRV